jgi:hypothetical protein
MIRPDSHLRQLIGRATPEQNARAMVKAKDFVRMCRRLGVEMTELPRVMKEALEMELLGEGDVGDVGKSHDDYFTRRQYGRNYTEP